jgi:hypothetical protein
MGEAPQPISKAIAIGSVSELGDEAMALLRPDLQPVEYVKLLVQKRLYPDAVRFLAHALPKREAVWWAWVSARRAAGSDPPPRIKACLQATEKWISDPNEERRRAAMAAAQAADLGTAAGCAGLAAFFSGGSLAPPEAPPVPPGEFLTAKAVSGAIIFSSLATEPEKAPEKFQVAISQGIDVTNRIKLWEQP